MNFWDELYKNKKMVLGLSPMDGVTDVAMRYMVGKYSRKSSDHSPIIAQGSELGGGVDVLFTEFVSVDALHYATGERRERLLKTFMRAREVHALIESGSDTVTQLNSDTAKWPYEVAQVFGHTPELFAEAAVIVEKMGFDGIDINMGCPMHKVEDQGSGAGLIRTPKLAQEIIRTVKSVTKLPVSVKTRIGVSSDVAEEWMYALMEAQPANISLHGRTLRQLYQGSADWESIGRAAAVVHKLGGHILGNGDVESIEDAKNKAKQYGVDGVLIGRAAEGRPGIFLESQSSDHSPIIAQGSELWRQRQFAWMIEHSKIYEQIFSEPELLSRSFMPMRKHLAWYCKGFPGAVEMRSKLMQANCSLDVERILVDHKIFD